MKDINEDFAELLKNARKVGGKVGEKVVESHPEIVESREKHLLCEMAGVKKETIEVREVDGYEKLKLVLGNDKSGTVYIGKLYYDEDIEVDKKDIEINNGIVKIYL